MKQLLSLLSLMLFVAVGTPTYAQGDKPSSDEIWYTTTDGQVVNPNNPEAFGSEILSNTYRNGKGVIIVEADCIVEIGKAAFSGCRNLKSITIPDSVTSIGWEAFWGCSSLTSITIPDSAILFWWHATSDCSSLTDTYVNITDLAAYATVNTTSQFPGAKHLMIDDTEITELVIPDSVTSIGCCAFSGCESLISITIPDSVTAIGDGAFRGCPNLSSFAGKFATADGRCLIANGKLIATAPSGLTRYSIPDSVTSIGESAFSGCSSLTSITIPDSVTSIGNEAFRDCSSLTSITIPDSVTSIGNWAFYGCSSLIRVTIPDSVTSIGCCAFSGCESLTKVYCKPVTPPSGDSSMFLKNALWRKIYVPRGSVNAYKQSKYWSAYANAIVGYDF